VDVEALATEAQRCVRAAAAPLATDWSVFATNPAFATRDLASFGPILGEATQAPVDLPFGTEAGQFVEQGIDAVVLGPGQIEQAHKADEFVALDELVQAVRIFERVMT
jgi:acetylornithine deacetylase